MKTAVITSLLLLSACYGDAKEGNVIEESPKGTNADMGASRPVVQSPANGEFGGVKPRMPYLEARRRLLASGFKPIRHTGWIAEVQDRFPEVDTCSNGAAYCAMYFIKNSRILAVGTVGGTPGDDPDVVVTDVDWIPSHPNPDDVQGPLPSGKSAGLAPLPESILNSDAAAVYGYTCRVNDKAGKLLLYTTDPTADDQTHDGWASLAGKGLNLDGDRRASQSGVMRLRDGAHTVSVEIAGGMKAQGDAGDQENGEGTLTLMPEQVKTPVSVSCVVQ